MLLSLLATLIGVFISTYSTIWCIAFFIVIMSIQTARLLDLKSETWSLKEQLKEIRRQRDSADENAKFWRFYNGGHWPADTNKEIKPN